MKQVKLLNHPKLFVNYQDIGFWKWQNKLTQRLTKTAKSKSLFFGESVGPLFFSLCQLPSV